MATMTTPQARFLRLVVEVGECAKFSPPVLHAEVWRVRIRVNGSSPIPFAQTVGDALVSLGYITLDQRRSVQMAADGVNTFRWYIPTPRGIAWVKKYPGKN